jgi:hypothetical protein
MVGLGLSGRRNGEEGNKKGYKMEGTTVDCGRSYCSQGRMCRRGIAAECKLHHTLYLALFLDHLYYGVISLYVLSESDLAVASQVIVDGNHSGL